MSTRDPRCGGFRRTLRRWLITGAALVIPTVVTLIILGTVLNFFSQLLNPLVRAAAMWLGFVDPQAEVDRLVVKVSAVVAAVATMLIIGIVADANPTDGRIAESFHHTMEGIPAIGSIYTGFRQMSEVVVESDVDNFQDVKLVEYPTEGSYTFAFVTADTPDHIERSTGRGDMVTVFMPMAPNPVMGGYVLHVDRDRVVDVDMTVEEGVRAIVTSGVTVTSDPGEREVSPERLRRIGVEVPTDHPELDNGRGAAERPAAGSEPGPDAGVRDYDREPGPGGTESQSARDPDRNRDATRDRDRE